MGDAKQLAGLIVQGSMFLMIMSIAMQSTPANVIEQIRHPKLVWRGLLAVNVVVPLVATLLALALPLEQPVRAGLLLMAVSPLAPLVPGNALKTGARRSSVIALYTLLILLAIVIVPLSIKVENAIFEANAVAPVALIAKVVLMSAVIPIALGLLLSALMPDFSKRVARAFTLIANLCLLLFVVLLLWVVGRQMLDMIGNGTIFAFLLTSGAGVVAGHLLGGHDPTNRGALALAASTRHPGIAAAIAKASGAAQPALAAIILFLLCGMIVGALYQTWLRHHPTAVASNAA